MKKYLALLLVQLLILLSVTPNSALATERGLARTAESKDLCQYFVPTCDYRGGDEVKVIDNLTVRKNKKSFITQQHTWCGGKQDLLKQLQSIKQAAEGAFEAKFSQVFLPLKIKKQHGESLRLEPKSSSWSTAVYFDISSDDPYYYVVDPERMKAAGRTLLITEFMQTGKEESETDYKITAVSISAGQQGNAKLDFATKELDSRKWEVFLSDGNTRAISSDVVLCTARYMDLSAQYFRTLDFTARFSIEDKDRDDCEYFVSEACRANKGIKVIFQYHVLDARSSFRKSTLSMLEADLIKSLRSVKVAAEQQLSVTFHQVFVPVRAEKNVDGHLIRPITGWLYAKDYYTAGNTDPYYYVISPSLFRKKNTLLVLPFSQIAENQGDGINIIHVNDTGKGLKAGMSYIEHDLAAMKTAISKTTKIGYADDSRILASANYTNLKQPNKRSKDSKCNFKIVRRG